MALSTCPQCGEQVSDKAKTCIHCGYDLSNLHVDNKNICPECGAELEEGAKFCPKCGCPIDDIEEESVKENFDDASKESKPQQVEVTGVRNGKKILIAIVAIILVIGVAAIAGTQIIKQRNDRIAVQESEDYKNDLSAINLLMLKGASDAESAGNLIKSVWSNCINEKSDATTDKYTINSYGNYYSDFNDALFNLFFDEDFQSDLSEIESNQNDVMSMMKDMKDPPDDWNDAYNALQDYYDAYITFTDMVLDPSGSLMTYSSNFNDADSDLLSACKKMSLYLE